MPVDSPDKPRRNDFLLDSTRYSSCRGLSTASINGSGRLRPPVLDPRARAPCLVLVAGLARFGGPFLAGSSFTAADAFFAPVAYRVRTYGLALDGAAAAYAERLLALPALRDWEAAALRETAREPGHEEEARRAGVWIEDRRAAAF